MFIYDNYPSQYLIKNRRRLDVKKYILADFKIMLWSSRIYEYMNMIAYYILYLDRLGMAQRWSIYCHAHVSEPYGL